MKESKVWSVLRWVAVPACALAFVGVLACASFSARGPVELPGSIPGATYVGAETCASCHEDAARYYEHDPHATAMVRVEVEGEEEDLAVDGCEACHGPGSLHVENDGAEGTILKENTDRCFACHVDVLAKFKLQHHHPVAEGRMTCSDCHDAHGEDSRATVGAMLKRSDEKCFKCHKEMKGPFVFEHEAMREGCQACHNPHGSVQDKMLVAGQSTTCLRCHYDINTNPSGNLSGGVAHGSTASTTGAKGGNYDVGRGEECIDHHRAPHGSSIWRTFNR